jgi:hypothetical protein
MEKLEKFSSSMKKNDFLKKISMIPQSIHFFTKKLDRFSESDRVDMK